MWRNLIRRLFFSKPEPKSAEQIVKDRQRWLDEGIEKSARLKKLIKSETSGWREFVVLLDDYLEKAAERKLITDISLASESEIMQLRLLDRDISVIQWVKQIPEQFIGKVDKELEAEQKKEEKNG